MNISKALKVKNRLVGEIARLKEIIRRENSRREDNPSKVDVMSVVKELLDNQDKLIRLKGAIGMATAPISSLLAEIAENKADINFYNSLPVREGVELVNAGGNKEAIKLNWTATLNRERTDNGVKKIQEKINSLQDEIDDFNAKTQVDFAE